MSTSKKSVSVKLKQDRQKKEKADGSFFKWHRSKSDKGVKESTKTVKSYEAPEIKEEKTDNNSKCFVARADIVLNQDGVSTTKENTQDQTDLTIEKQVTSNLQECETCGRSLNRYSHAKSNCVCLQSPLSGPTHRKNTSLLSQQLTEDLEDQTCAQTQSHFAKQIEDSLDSGDECPFELPQCGSDNSLLSLPISSSDDSLFKPSLTSHLTLTTQEKNHKSGIDKTATTTVRSKSFHGHRPVNDGVSVRHTSDKIPNSRNQSVFHLYNKPLRIITAVQRTKQRFARRASSPSLIDHLNMSPKDSFEKSVIADHLLFVEFMKKLTLSSYLKFFPSSMDLFTFRSLTEHQLIHMYHVDEPKVRMLLMKAIRTAQNDFELGSQSDCGPVASPSPLQSPLPRKSREEISFGLHGNLRRLQRTLSEEMRRLSTADSTPSTPTAVPPSASSLATSQKNYSHSVGVLVDHTNLIRIRNNVSGQSAPSLLANFKDINRKANISNTRKGPILPPTMSPTLPHRCLSPQAMASCIPVWFSDVLWENDGNS